MEQISGGITSAQGFYAAGAEAAIKYKGRMDMAMVYSKVPCVGAGVFTSNLVKAAPVQWDQKVIKTSPAVQAIVVNAGIANACTGALGMENCEKAADAVAKELSIPSDSVIIGSTGVIGVQLPIDRIIAGVAILKDALADTKDAGTQAAKAIMTTDTIKKEVAVTFSVGGKTATLGGMSKGSGMIHPNMCTMLCYLSSDVAIAKPLLQKAVETVVKDSFNMISVDGDTSTNDTFIVMANGLCKNAEITEENDDYQAFVEALMFVAKSLARTMASDGEGASKLIEAVVMGADTKETAVKLSKSVIGSSLVKTAIYGSDSNWGRIMCALGYAGASFDPEKVDLYYESDQQKLMVCKSGILLDYSEEKASQILGQKEVRIICDLHMGEETATAWGCDLTYDYVKINADYRS